LFFLGRTPLLSRPGRFSAENTMFIDAITRRALELTKTQFGYLLFSPFSLYPQSTKIWHFFCFIFYLFLVE
jgi:hypothetical protein